MARYEGYATGLGPWKVGRGLPSNYDGFNTNAVAQINGQGFRGDQCGFIPGQVAGPDNQPIQLSAAVNPANTAFPNLPGNINGCQVAVASPDGTVTGGEDGGGAIALNQNYVDGFQEGANSLKPGR